MTDPGTTCTEQIEAITVHEPTEQEPPLPAESRAQAHVQDAGKEREELESAMAPLVGMPLAEKPRPFSNAAPIWGSGSCYMNTALQCLFASNRIRLLMARIIAERCHDTEHARRLWHFCRFASLSDIEKLSSAPAGTWNDNTLALTFASVMQGQTSDGQSLLGRPLLPALFLREYYTGAQEDANMFLMKCLQLCPRTLQMFKGRHHRAELACNLCGHRGHCGELASAVDEQEFTSIQLETRNEDTGTLITSIATALSVSCKEPVDANFEARCTNVGCGARWSFKIYLVERAPQIEISFALAQGVGT